MPVADSGRIRTGGTAPTGFLGLEILRQFTEKRRTNITALLGAFRGQCERPSHRLKGSGTWSGPLNIESGSARLTLPQFRAALLELNISLPERESKAIFNVMAVNGTLSVSDLIREIRLDPCDRSARWGREGVGHQYLPAAEMPKLSVLPTPASGYTQGPHRVARPKSAAVTRLELQKAKEDWAGRIAPTRTSGYAGAIAQSDWLKQLDAAMLQKPKPQPAEGDGAEGAARVFLSRPRSAYGTIYASTPGLLHPKEQEPDQYTREGIGRNRTKPAEPTGRPAPTEGSGYTRDQGVITLGPDWVDPPKTQAPWRVADSRHPWTSGYNRGLKMGIVLDAWADDEYANREGIGRKPMPMAEFDPNVPNVPTRGSGYIMAQMCSVCQEAPAKKGGVCAFCRV